jgi:hypothetical protein
MGSRRIRLDEADELLEPGYLPGWVCHEEMTCLAGFLPDLYREETGEL